MVGTPDSKGNIVNMVKPPLKYAIRLKHTGDFGRIEHWLGNYCQGGYDYKFDGVHETDSVFDQLEILFRFEDKHDAMAFRDFLRTEIA